MRPHCGKPKVIRNLNGLGLSDRFLLFSTVKFLLFSSRALASSLPMSSVAWLMFSSSSFINSLYFLLTLLAILSLSSMV